MATIIGIASKTQLYLSIQGERTLYTEDQAKEMGARLGSARRAGIPVLNSSSIDWPEDDGWSYERLDAFLAKVYAAEGSRLPDIGIPAGVAHTLATAYRKALAHEPPAMDGEHPEEEWKRWATAGRWILAALPSVGDRDEIEEMLARVEAWPASAD